MLTMARRVACSKRPVGPRTATKRRLTLAIRLPPLVMSMLMAMPTDRGRPAVGRRSGEEGGAWIYMGAGDGLEDAPDWHKESDQANA